MTKRMRRVLAGIAGLLLLCTATVQAAGESAVVEHYTVGEEAVLYVRGVEEEAEVDSFQIGTITCATVSLAPVRETEEGIKTLILWDNSLSVMKRCGDRVKAILTDVIANRVAGETFAIAIIDKKITYLSDYTDDYAALKEIVENVSGEDKDAYIIENLYQAIVSLNEMDDVSYKRILLISDGMDAMEIGYSKSELDDLISQTPYPVYTIGMLSGDHQNELQDMFALSRTTGVDYFYLNEIEDDMMVVRALSADYSVLQIKVAIPADMQDGSMRNSQLVLNAGGNNIILQSQVSMPFASQEKAEESSTEELSAEQESIDNSASMDTEPSRDSEAVPTNAKAGEEKGGTNMVAWMITAAAAIILLLAGLAVVLVKRGKGRETPPMNDYKMLDSRIKNRRRGSAGAALSSSVRAPVSKAEVIGAGGSGEPESKERHDTKMLFSNAASEQGVPESGVGVYRLTLTNVKDRVRTYQCNITDRVIIGRNPSVSNLMISDDAVSEKHCEIGLSHGKFYVKDLESSNGTYVDGIRISAAAEVHTGTVLRLGRHEYRLTIE
ncbi:MAG: FHA domain-containing protein [Acetatifactor sp.]|nr:FHA domain-containing protein [Acetatifactor sp.]